MERNGRTVNINDNLVRFYLCRVWMSVVSLLLHFTVLPPFCSLHPLLTCPHRSLLCNSMSSCSSVCISLSNIPWRFRSFCWCQRLNFRFGQGTAKGFCLTSIGINPLGPSVIVRPPICLSPVFAHFIMPNKISLLHLYELSFLFLIDNHCLGLNRVVHVRKRWA